MSYGSEICPECHGELRVYYDGDGSCAGTCPTCGFRVEYAPRVIRSRIPDEGAFYEVLVNEYVMVEDVRPDGTPYLREKTVRLMASLAIYTDLDAALKRAKEARETDGGSSVYTYIKKWNHARTDYEWWRPEWKKEASA